MTKDYLRNTSKDDMLSLMSDNISDAMKAILSNNYASAQSSLNNAAFWAGRISETFGDN